MTITTHPRIWMHRSLLPFVHEANHQIEYVAGDWAGLLSVIWDLVEADGGPSLSVRIVDTTRQRAPLTLAGVADLPLLMDRLEEWRQQK